MGFIAPALWNDEKLRKLPLASKAAFVYLLTGPESLMIPGLLVGDATTVAGGIREPVQVIEEAMRKLEEARLISCDHDERLIRVPNAPRYNAPPNGNVLASWYRRWVQIHDCPLKFAHVASVRAAVELRILEATKKKAKKGVVESWRTAWDETFGGAGVHDKQRDMFTSVYTSSQQLLKPLGEPLNSFSAEGRAPRSTPTLSGREGECVNSSDSGSDSDVCEEMDGNIPPERDQVVKRLVQPSDPRSQISLQIPDPDPRSQIQIQIPDAWAEGSRPGATVIALPRPAQDTLQERISRAWRRQEELRAEVGLRPKEATEERLRPVGERCAERSDAEIEHVLLVYAANVRERPDTGVFFNGESNWRRVDFERTLDALLPKPKKMRGHHSVEETRSVTHEPIAGNPSATRARLNRDQ